jgi:hypothetical protein
MLDRGRVVLRHSVVDIGILLFRLRDASANCANASKNASRVRASSSARSRVDRPASSPIHLTIHDLGA